MGRMPLPRRSGNGGRPRHWSGGALSGRSGKPSRNATTSLSLGENANGCIWRASWRKSGKPIRRTRNICSSTNRPPVWTLQHQHSTLQIARQWAGRGAGVLVILHDLNLAMTYVDKVLLLDRGKTVAHDEVEKVLTPEILGPVFKVETQVLTIEGQTRPQLVTHPREASAGFNGG